MILAIDSSTAWAGIALLDPDDGRLIDEQLWHVGAEHGRQLLSRIDGLLRWHSIERAALTGIGVAIGPGTFNGVRIAVTTAKTISHTLGIGLAGIDTLEIYAASMRSSGLLVRPVLPAARGDVATSLWRAGATLERLEDTRLAPFAEVAARYAEPTVLLGEIDADRRRLIQVGAENAILLSPAQCARRPGLLAELAAERLARGAGDDPRGLTPLYLRPPHITPPRR